MRSDYGKDSDGVSDCVMFGELSGSQAKSFPFAEYVKNDNVTIKFIQTSFLLSRQKYKINSNVSVEDANSSYTAEDISKLESAASKWYGELCSKIIDLYQELYREYYNEKFVEEYINDNNFDFDEDGNVIRS